MAITKVNGWFSKTGKGYPQVELKNFDGTPMVEEKIGTDGKPVKVPVIGNEQYLADQLTAESVSAESVEAFMEDVLSACDSDLAFAAKAFRTGWNRETRLSAGGSDEYQKAAKQLIKSGLPFYSGKTVDEVAEFLRKQEAAQK